MKRMPLSLTLFSSLTLLALLTGCTAPPAGEGDTAGGGWPSRENLGARVFQANCVRCHGADGQGNGQPNRSLVNVERQKDDDIVRVIEDGGKIMPSWKGKLKDEEIAAVAAYVKQF